MTATNDQTGKFFQLEFPAFSDWFQKMLDWANENGYSIIRYAHTEHSGGHTVLVKIA